MTVIDAQITRAAPLTPTPLDLMSSGLEVADAGWDTGRVVHKIVHASSIYVDGEVPVAIAKQNRKGTVKMWVKASSHSAIETLLQDLMPAFNQYSYNLSIVMDSVTYQWLCYRADYLVGFTREFAWGLACPVTFNMPINPLPSVGPV